jgi:hypothetical protein
MATLTKTIRATLKRPWLIIIGGLSLWAVYTNAPLKFDCEVAFDASHRIWPACQPFTKDLLSSYDVQHGINSLGGPVEITVVPDDTTKK